MAHTDAMTDTIRVRIEPSKKRALTRMYKKRNTNISQAVRVFLDTELSQATTEPLDRFDSIMADADKKINTYGAPEPTINDIVEFVNNTRKDRAKTGTL